MPVVNWRDPEEASLAAGEYVLGTASREEAAEIEREAVRNATLRRAIGDWQTRLDAMSEVAAPVEPSPGLWPRIERGLHARTLPPARAVVRPGWWESVALWRWTSVVASLAIVVLAVLVLVQRPPEVGVAYIAVLEAPDRTPGWVVRATAGQPVRLTPLGKTTVAADRALQFWTLYDRAQGPVSLGLIEPDRPAQIPAERLPGLKTGQLFEITLEPYGGSPTGRPTGTILYKGLTVESF